MNVLVRSFTLRRATTAALAFSSLTSLALAQAAAPTVADPVQLDAFEVSERGVSRANNILKFTDIAPTSPSGANALNALSRLPGVNSTSSTNYGLRNGDGTGLRLRAFTLSVLGVAIDGIPAAATNGFQTNPPTRFFDTENVNTVEVSPGTGELPRLRSRPSVDRSTFSPAVPRPLRVRNFPGRSGRGSCAASSCALTPVRCCPAWRRL